MDKYELVMVVDAAVPQEEKESIVKEAGEAIGKCDGQVINSQVWLDKHKFAFLIKKRMEGTYYTVNFEGQRSGFSKLRGMLKMNERILRSLIVKAE